ncbi:MAG: hypothetical protein ACT4NY_30975 [Pseudonocardiales bacterium]
MSDPGLYERLALRRVHDGGIAKSAGVYLDHGRPTPGYLADLFDQLIWTGCATVADGDGIWGLRGVSLTESGHARYAEQCEQEGAPGHHRSPVPDPTQTPAGSQSAPTS